MYKYTKTVTALVPTSLSIPAPCYSTSQLQILDPAQVLVSGTDHTSCLASIPGSRLSLGSCICLSSSPTPKSDLEALFALLIWLFIPYIEVSKGSAVIQELIIFPQHVSKSFIPLVPHQFANDSTIFKIY